MPKKPELPIGHRRLLVLARFLERNVRAANFDMGAWGYAKRQDIHACGSSACALGWATQIPEFHKSGLQGDWQETIPGAFSLVIKYWDAEEQRRYFESEAARQFFGLSNWQTQKLFFRQIGHVKKTEVARNIRRFVATGELP